MPKTKTAKKKNITIDTLAVMVQNGFIEMGGRFDKVENRLDKVENRLDKVENRLDKVENRVGSLEKEMTDGFLRVNARLDAIEMNIKELDVISRVEFEDLMDRVKYIETKLGIVSGK